MEHYLLSSLYDVVASKRPTDQLDISALNVAAWRMLNSPYLGSSYQAWKVAEIAPDQWRLVQRWKKHEVIDRDVMAPFYPDMFWEEEDLPGAHYQVKPVKASICPARVVEELEGVSDEVCLRAQFWLDAHQQTFPREHQRLFAPNDQQLGERARLTFQWVEGQELVEQLRTLLGDTYDASLKSYGIEYHIHNSFERSKQLYLIAHNGQELAGVLFLGNHEPWAYSLGYVSVAPGFRQKGLSAQLFDMACARCVNDDKVLVRSEPGAHTPVRATLTYDGLVRHSNVVHTTSSGPLYGRMQQLWKEGINPAQHASALKAACDDVVPTAQDRMEQTRVEHDWVWSDMMRSKHAAAFDEVLHNAHHHQAHQHTGGAVRPRLKR